MNDFRSRKKEKIHFIYSPFFSVILFIILLLVLSSVYKSYEKKVKIDSERNKFDKKYESLLNRKEELQSKIRNLQTEEGIKEELKKTYNIGEEGETVIHITK